MILDSAVDPRDGHALGVYLDEITPRQLYPDEPFDVRFRVVNTGSKPIDLPISPDLADLQPEDPAVEFEYASLALVVTVQATGLKIPRTAYVEFYGSISHDGTILALEPGRWITVKAKLKLDTWPGEGAPATAKGGFWLRRNTYKPHSGGSFRQIENLNPNVTSTPSLEVQLLPHTLAR